MKYVIYLRQDRNFPQAILQDVAVELQVQLLLLSNRLIVLKRYLVGFSHIRDKYPPERHRPFLIRSKRLCPMMNRIR